MAQHDYVLDNATGANFRSDLNNALLAISSNNSGSSAPSTTYALQFYADTTNNILKLRNAANDGFINLFTLAGGVDVDAASNFNEDVTFTGASANVVFDKSDNALEFADDAMATFGTSADLRIRHNGSNSLIEDMGTGNLQIRGDDIHITGTNDEILAKFIENTGVELYHDGSSKKFETTSSGVNITGVTVDDGATHDGDVTFTGASANITFDKSSNELLFADNAKASFGNNGDLVIRHDGSSSIVEDNGTGPLNIQTNNSNINIKGGSSASDTMAIFKSTEGVELYFNNSKKAETVTGGFTVTGTCTATAFAGDGSALTGISGTATTINNNADTRVITGSGTANTLNAKANVVIDSSSRFIVGPGQASRSVGDVAAQMQVEGQGFASSSLSLISNAGASAGNTPHITMGKSRGSSVGSNTAVANGDALGQLQYAGADGTDCNTVACSIIGRVDGAPGSNDMPGTLTFLTTSDGGSVPSERMRLDSSGVLNIGATSYGGGGSQPMLYIVGTSGRQVKIHNTSSGTCALQLSNAGTGEGDDAGLMLSSLSDGQANISNAENHNLLFGTNNNTRLCIKGNGDMIFGGATSVEAQANITFEADRDDGSGRITFNRANTSNVSICIEMQNNNAQSGRIEYDNSSCGIFSSSDYRAKENDVAISDGITRVKQLRPIRFNFKVEPSKTVDGFFAHEVSSIVPEAISGEKDGVDSDNNPVYQAIDQSKLVPLLVAAVQELVTRVETLEAA